MKLWNEIKEKVFDWLTNRLLPEGATAGQVPVKQSNGTWSGVEMGGGGGDMFIVASGTNNYTATVDGFTDYTTGMGFKVQFTNASTSSPITLNINSVGAKTIDIESFNAGDIRTLIYDGTKFVTDRPILPIYKDADEERVLFTTDNQIKNDYEIIDIFSATGTTAQDLEDADWTDGIVALDGIVGERRILNEWEYQCNETDKWVRIPMNLNYVDLVAAKIDDSGGIKTSAYMQTNYPDVVDGQYITGANGFYMKLITDWFYVENKI